MYWEQADEVRNKIKNKFNEVNKALNDAMIEMFYQDYLKRVEEVNRLKSFFNEHHHVLEETYKKFLVMRIQ